MVGLVKEPVYVTYTCKNPKCRKAFIDLDPYNDINDEPLQTRYCPDCVKLGFKNEKYKSKKDRMAIVKKRQDPRGEYIKTHIKELGIKDQREKRFIISYCNKQNKHKTSVGVKIIISSIFRDALEVLSYQKWKQ